MGLGEYTPAGGLLLTPDFQQYNAVPPTPLLTSNVLKEENELWPDVQEGMSLALREMRVDQVTGMLHLIGFTMRENLSSVHFHL